MTSRADREIIRNLAGRVAEIAALPVQRETIRLWKALNALRPERPMVMIDQVPWHEMEVDSELTLQTTGEFCRGVEKTLRQALYKWRHMRADMVVRPYLDIPRVISGGHLGISAREKTAVTDPKGDVLGHQYFDQLHGEADLEKIRPGRLVVDVRATDRLENQARDLLDGLLEVRMQGLELHFTPWDYIVCVHGVENSILDLIRRPDFAHKIIARFTDAYLSRLDQAEEKGLLCHGQETIHCTGAHTDQLPAPGFDPRKTRARDLWTFGMAQIFSTVSPAMHREFELEYANRWYRRFGLVYYGCCEPLHLKVDIIRKIPNLRKISMSPWTDQEIGAQKIGPDFVFSRKPSPALVAGETWQPDLVRKDLEDTLRICSRHHCPLEFILKDISTVRYQPQRLREWEHIAMSVVGAGRQQGAAC